MILVKLPLTVLLAANTKLCAATAAGLTLLLTVALNAVLSDLIKIMAKAIITFRLMPESPDTDLEPIKQQAQAIAKEKGAIGQMQVKEDPIAFGLKAVLVLAMYTVDDTNFDAIAEEMAQIEGVQNAEVAKMDLALG